MILSDIADKTQTYRNAFNDKIDVFNTRYAQKKNDALSRKNKLEADAIEKYAQNEAKLQQAMSNIQEEYINTLASIEKWVDDKTAEAQEWLSTQINALTDNFKNKMEAESKENEQALIKNRSERKKSDAKIDALIK